jgi:hypothetical protein
MTPIAVTLAGLVSCKVRQTAAPDSMAWLDLRRPEATSLRRAFCRGGGRRPRKRGERLPTPEAMLDEHCHRVSLAIYDRREQVRLSDRVARLA